MKKKISILLIALLFLPCVLIFTVCGNVEYSIVYELQPELVTAKHQPQAISTALPKE